jgi:3-hydroxyisobutyrate dehydrogenase-like beta-hydroxyacid dehydrogenase
MSKRRNNKGQNIYMWNRTKNKNAKGIEKDPKNQADVASLDAIYSMIFLFLFC